MKQKIKDFVLGLFVGIPFWAFLFGVAIASGAITK